MKKSNVAFIVILVLSIALAGAVGYIIAEKTVDKVEVDNNNSNNNGNNNSTTVTPIYEKINYEIETDGDLDNLKINGRYVVMGALHGGIDVEQFADLLLVTTGNASYVTTLQIVDKNGNIVGSIGDNNSTYSQIKGSILDYTYKKVIDGNTITLRTTNVASDYIWGICQQIEKQKSLNQPAKYLVKLTYLGNGKFEEPIILNTISATEYENEMNLDCNKCINSGKEFSDDNNCEK